MTEGRRGQWEIGEGCSFRLSVQGIGKDLEALRGCSTDAIAGSHRATQSRKSRQLWLGGAMGFGFSNQRPSLAEPVDLYPVAVPKDDVSR